MKITAGQYARVLYDSLAGKDQKADAEAVKAFAALLARQRNLGRKAEITAAFEALWNEEQGELPAVIESARPLDAGIKTAAIAYLKNRTEAASVSLSEKVDPALIGGFILRYGDRVVDGSLKSNLSALGNKIRN